MDDLRILIELSSEEVYSDEDAILNFNGTDDEEIDFYDDFDECGFDPYMGCYTYDC